MSNPSVSTSVLIVGGGPVGLALAADLGSRNVACLLVDKRDGSVGLPKMNMVSARTMEFCRRWGIAKDVRRLSIPEDFPRRILFVTSANGYELARFEYPSRRDAVLVHSPEYLQRCSQIYFDPLLRDHAASYPSVTLRYHTAFLELEQDSSGVTARIESAIDGSAETVRASYVVACDGAESTVREQLGIPLLGDHVLSVSANIYFTTPEPNVIMPYGKTIMQWLIDETGQWAGLISVDGAEKWRLGINRCAVPPTTEDARAAIRKAVGRDFEFEVKSILPWTRRRVVAERYRAGRVFLAGDSAHQLSPTGGFGMNTGIGDAMDLSWMLSAAVEGWAGSDLLDAYDAERRPIADIATREATQNFLGLQKIPSGPEIAQPGEDGERLRRAVNDYIRNGDFYREYESDGVTFGYHYEDSPIVVSEAGAPPPFDPSRYRQTARAGHRAPHAWIGPDQSTIDLFGRGFTLLCLNRSETEARPLLEAATRKRVPVRVFASTDPDLATAYETLFVLVRPDGHVAWRDSELPGNPAALIDRIRGERSPAR